MLRREGAEGSRLANQQLTEDSSDPADARGSKWSQAESLEPLARSSALSPFGAALVPANSLSAVAPPPVDAASARTRASLEEILQHVVRRVAWSGDRHVGSVRMELGAGALSGATLFVEADPAGIRVSIDVPPGVDANHWRERLARRLSDRGLQVTSLEIG